LYLFPPAGSAEARLPSPARCPPLSTSAREMSGHPPTQPSRVIGKLRRVHFFGCSFSGVIYLWQPLPWFAFELVQHQSNRDPFRRANSTGKALMGEDSARESRVEWVYREAVTSVTCLGAFQPQLEGAVVNRAARTAPSPRGRPCALFGQRGATPTHRAPKDIRQHCSGKNNVLPSSLTAVRMRTGPPPPTVGQRPGQPRSTPPLPTTCAQCYL